jgi:hypothetical protein
MAQARPPIARPQLSTFGNTFVDSVGAHIDQGVLQTSIDRAKLNTGTDSSTEEFTEFETTIKDYILAQLGHPVVRVELAPFQLRTCIDEAISKLNYHAPLWMKQLAVFDASAGINMYELPKYMVDNLEYVVYKKTLLSIQSQAGTLEFDFFIKYFQDNFLFQNFGVADFYLLQQNLEMTRKILSQEGSFNVVDGKYLLIMPTPVVTPQQVLVEYRAISTESIHPAYRNWIQRFSLAGAKGILGQIRGKYAVLPSPGGGSQLNGEALLAQSKEEKQILLEELLFEIEGPPAFTAY